MRKRFYASWSATALSCALAACILTLSGEGVAASRTGVPTSSDTEPGPTAPLRYDGHFGGLRVADIELTLGDSGAAYDTRMIIDAEGVIGWFYTWHGELRASGTLDDDQGPRPQAFRRSWQDSEDQGATVVTYDDSGVAQGIEDGEPQDKVPETLRSDVLDPLATLMAMRRMVLDDRRGDARFPVYDGKRRLDLRADIGAAKTVDLRGRTVSVVPVSAAIEPRAGFSDRQRDGWRATRLHVLFSDDARALPVQIRVDSPVGTAVMNLSCPTGDTATCA